MQSCAVQADVVIAGRTSSQPDTERRVGQRPAAQRAGLYWSGGQSPCGRLNITRRYANRRSVTALAMLHGAMGVPAGKRCASPSLRITRVHVLRPRKSKSRSPNGACGRVCCAHPPTRACARSAPASAGARGARGPRPRLRPGPSHALVSREGYPAPDQRRPGKWTGAGRLPGRKASPSGRCPDTPLPVRSGRTFFLLTIDRVEAEDRHRLKPNRITGTPRSACRSRSPRP